MRDDEILAPLTWAKVWAHHRELARAAEILHLLHGQPDWHYGGVYGPTNDFGILWVYAHEPTGQVWLFGLTPHFRWASDAAETHLLEGRWHPVPAYAPEALPGLLVELGLPAGEAPIRFTLGEEGDERDGAEEPRDSAVRRRSPAQQRAYEARRRRLEELVAGDLVMPRPGRMNRYQRRAYEAPIDETKAPPGSLHQEENGHTEVYQGVQLSVLLTADVGRAGEDRFGRRGLWHCSVAVWRDKPGPPARPLAVSTWTPAQRAAAEQVARRNLAGIGEGEVIAGQEGEYALHGYVPMSQAERDGLGLP